MAERNAIKVRACALCGAKMVGKASTLKKHGRECKKQNELAAATAIMQQMQEEMSKSASVAMADERVLNAEGD